MRLSLLAVSTALLLSIPLVSAADVRQDEEMRRSWTFPDVKPGQLLEIRLRTGAGLSITAWNRDEVSVASDWTETRCRDARFDVTRTAQGVRVETRYPAGTGVIYHNCSFGITVKVPRRFDVQVRSAGGSVAIRGVRGDFQGQTGGGKIELHDLSGSVRLRTGGGRIVVQDSDLEGHLSTGGGRVTFENVSGGVTARSGSQRGVVRGRTTGTI